MRIVALVLEIIGFFMMAFIVCFWAMWFWHTPNRRAGKIIHDRRARLASIPELERECRQPLVPKKVAVTPTIIYQRVPSSKWGNGSQWQYAAWSATNGSPSSTTPDSGDAPAAG